MENEKVVQILKSDFNFFALTNFGNIYQNAGSATGPFDSWVRMKPPNFTEDDLADELETE